MKSPLLVIAILFVITAVAVAKERGKDWTLLGASQGGRVLLSVRNFKSVTPGDRFTYEQKLDYAPGAMYLNSEKVTSAESIILVSCTLRQAKIQTDTVYSGTRIISKDVLAKTDEMGPVPESSPLFVVISTVCDAAPKDTPKKPEKITII